MTPSPGCFSIFSPCSTYHRFRSPSSPPPNSCSLTVQFTNLQVYYLSLNYTYCDDFHDVVPFECTCAFDTTDANRVYLDSVLQAYNQRIFKLTRQWQAKQLDDFTVQTQNFTANCTCLLLFKAPKITNFTI